MVKRIKSAVLASSTKTRVVGLMVGALLVVTAGFVAAAERLGDKRLLRQEEWGTQDSPKRFVHGQRDRDILEPSRPAGTSRPAR